MEVIKSFVSEFLSPSIRYRQESGISIIVYDRTAMCCDTSIEYRSIGCLSCFHPVYPDHCSYERDTTIEEGFCFESRDYFPSFDKATSLEKIPCLAVREESCVVFIDCRDHRITIYIRIHNSESREESVALALWECTLIVDHSYNLSPINLYHPMTPL